MKCPKCGRENDEFLGKCESCGADLERPLESDIPQSPPSYGAARDDSSPIEEKPAAIPGPAPSCCGGSAPRPAYKASGSTNQYATISAIMGGAGLLSSIINFICCFGWVTFPLSVGAVILGFMALKQIKEQGDTGKNKQLAITGIVLGFAALAILFIVIFIRVLIGILSS
ncbi:MAG TPA: DUF4190 domain-containing protein [Candidatus Sumerlaeota bacterium]|nr:DUF4190 domain-containing protein [Candidatus Sumerlaeota bacterium]